MNRGSRIAGTPAAGSGGHLGAATLWMTGALVSFSISALSVRELARSLSVFEMLSLRSLFGIVAVFILASAGPGGLSRLSTNRPGLQGLRHGIHWIGQVGWAYGVTALPLATVFAIEFTAPAWVALLAVLFLGERLTLPRLGAVVLGIVGVLIIVRPGQLPVGLPTAAVLASAISFAVTFVATKELTRTDTTLAILFWMNVVQLPLNLVWCDPAFPLRIDAGQVPAVLGVCVSGLTSHWCITQAFRNGDATLIVPLDFLRVPLIAVIGWWLYAEVLDPFVLLGAVVVVVGIGWNLVAARPKPR